MLLTDEQIDLIVLNHAPPIHPDCQQDDDHHALCRAIEAAVLAELAKQEPVAAQIRFRHPQKSMPDWSIWQPTKINKDHKSYYIDSQGYEVEYRLLYRHSAPVPEGMALVPERIEKVKSGFRGMFLKEAQAYKRGWNDCRAAMIAAAEKGQTP